MPRLPSVPAYLLHRSTGQARVRIDGRDHYLGLHGSPKSRQEYARLMAERFRPGGGIPTTPSLFPPSNGTFGGTINSAGTSAKIPLNEMFVRYLNFADTYYVCDGTPTGETNNMKDAIRSVRALYDHMSADEFGPLALKAVRHHMIETEGLSRNVINQRINRNRRHHYVTKLSRSRNPQLRRLLALVGANVPDQVLSSHLPQVVLHTGYPLQSSVPL